MTDKPKDALPSGFMPFSEDETRLMIGLVAWWNTQRAAHGQAPLDLFRSLLDMSSGFRAAWQSAEDRTDAFPPVPAKTMQ